MLRRMYDTVVIDSHLRMCKNHPNIDKFLHLTQLLPSTLLKRLALKIVMIGRSSGKLSKQLDLTLTFSTLYFIHTALASL